MRNTIKYALVALLFVSLGQRASAQGEAIVDFGHTGTIVVEQDAKSEGFETGYVYWFYDWFFDDRIPPTKLPPFQPPINSNPGNGGGDDTDQDCTNAISRLLFLQSELLLAQQALDDFTDKHGKTVVFQSRGGRGGDSYNSTLARLAQEVKDQEAAVADADAASREACN